MVQTLTQTTRVTAINASLITLTVVMLTFISTMAYTFVKLQISRPLENLTAYVTQPVYTGQQTLEFTGTFDRQVACQLTGFTLMLNSSTTNDVYVLDKRHLVIGPANEKGPGSRLTVEFTLEMPTSLKSGFWTPEFQGHYACRLGIFTDLKHETVNLSGFYVYPAKSQ